MTPCPGSNLADHAARVLTVYSGWVVSAVIVITGLLLIPLFLMRPTEQASRDPGGPVFDLQELVNKRFPTRVHIASFIAEDRDGDILRQAPLWELYRTSRRFEARTWGTSCSAVTMSIPRGAFAASSPSPTPSKTYFDWTGAAA